MPPNVIVIVLDAARRDAFEPYGAPAGASPVVRDLASRGTAFEEVYAPGCWTAPSHASFFTGRLPRALGVAGVPGGMPQDVGAQLSPDRDRMLPAVLRRNGYRTVLATTNLWLAADGGFGTGVDEFISTESRRQAQLESRSLRQRARRALEAARARADDGAGAIERQLAPLLGSGPQPFFCVVNLVEAHSPYLAPHPFAVGSPLERIRAAEDSARHYTLPGIWRTCLGGLDFSPEAEARLRRQYAASIRALDAWVGRLVENLDRAGRLDDTLVIITADHGENFGDGGLIAHALSLDNRLIHVPFVVAGPGAAWPAPAPMSLASLPRFIAESIGIEEHPWDSNDLPAGAGVAQFDPPALPDNPTPRRVIIDEWGLGEEALERFMTPLTCAVAGPRKLLLRGGEELWIDLDEDPLELSPRPASDAPPGDRDELERLRAVLRHPGVTANRPWGPDAPEVAPEELADLEERMKLLGYM